MKTTIKSLALSTLLAIAGCTGNQKLEKLELQLQKQSEAIEQQTIAIHDSERKAKRRADDEEYNRQSADRQRQLESLVNLK